MNANEWAAAMARIEAKNLAEGKCPKCGGGGVVADLAAINRTGDPHRNRTCRACRGTGLPTPETKEQP